MVEFDPIADKGEETKVTAPREYRIDPDAAEASGRLLSVLVASRRCYTCQQGFDEDEVVATDPQVFIDQVAAHCSGQPDYLLTDTPMKEAVFRVLLAHNNGPMDSGQISAVLSEKWAMTPSPRSTSPEVVQRLLDNSEYYCISAVPDSDPDDAEHSGRRRTLLTTG